MRKIIIGILMLSLFLTGCGNTEMASNPLPEDAFWTIAHRGASAYAPENTLASYDLAEEMEADYIELDIHLTKDGEIVIMHDEDVERTTEGTGYIADYTLSELKELSADFQFEDKEETIYRVPTLAEVFDQFGDEIHYFIELKDSDKDEGIEEALIDLLEQYDMIGTAKDGKPRTVVHSFSEKRLQRVHELNQKIPLVKLISFKDEKFPELTQHEVDDILKYGAGIAINYEFLDRTVIKQMHEEGLLVYATAVQDAEAALHMKEIGANGIYTNRPDLLENGEAE